MRSWPADAGDEGRADSGWHAWHGLPAAPLALSTAVCARGSFGAVFPSPLWGEGETALSSTAHAAQDAMKLCVQTCLPCPFAGDRLAGAPQAHALDTRLAQAVAPGRSAIMPALQARAPLLRRLLAVVLGCARRRSSVSDARGYHRAWAGLPAAGRGWTPSASSISRRAWPVAVACAPGGRGGRRCGRAVRHRSRRAVAHGGAVFSTRQAGSTGLEYASDALLVKRSAGHWAAHEAALKCWARPGGIPRPRWRAAGWCARRPHPAGLGRRSTWWPPSPGAPNRHAVQIAIDATKVRRSRSLNCTIDPATVVGCHHLGLRRDDGQSFVAGAITGHDGNHAAGDARARDARWLRLMSSASFVHHQRPPTMLVGPGATVTPVTLNWPGLAAGVGLQRRQVTAMVIGVLRPMGLCPG